MNSIDRSLQSVTSAEELQQWLEGDTPVSGYIGICGGRRFCKADLTGSVALKDLVRKANTIAHKVPSESIEAFSRAAQKIKDLDVQANRALEASNPIQWLLTRLWQLIGNWEYDWKEDLTVLPELAVARSTLETELVCSRDRPLKMWSRSVIRQMLLEHAQGVTEVRKLYRLHQKKVKMICFKEEGQLQIMLRVRRTQGHTKKVFQRVRLLGETRGSRAYYKARRGDEEQENRQDLVREVERSRTISTGGFDKVLLMKNVLHQDGSLKGVEAPWSQFGDLKQRLQKKRLISEEEKLKWSTDIFEALAWLHDENFLHGDLKSANILLFQNPHDSRKLDALLADFGSSTGSGETEEEEGASTPIYSPPEQFSNERKTGAGDVWAAGLILFELFEGVGHNLFLSKRHMRSPSGALYCNEDLFNPGNFSNLKDMWEKLRNEMIGTMQSQGPIRALITDLLDVDPQKRLSAHDALERVRDMRAKGAVKQ